MEIPTVSELNRGPRLMRGCSKLTDYLRATLGEPQLSEKTVREWIAAGKLRVGKFGGSIITSEEDVDRQLAESLNHQ